MLAKIGNTYDRLIIFTLAIMSAGILFSPVTLPRILSIIFIPIVIKNFPLIRKRLPIYVTLFLFSWLLFATLSIVYSYSKTDAFKFVIYNSCSVSIFLSLFLFSLRASNPCQSIVKGFIIMVVLTSIIALWEFTTGNHLSCNYTEELYLGNNEMGITIERVYASVTFGNLNYYVVILCFALPFLLFGIYLDKMNKKTCVICIVIISLIIVINASRGGLLCLMLSILTALYYYRHNRVITKSTILLITIITIALLIYFADLILVQIMSKLATDGGTTGDDSRMNIYKNCINILYLTNGMGSGMGGLEKALESVAPSDIPAPHNLLLEFLSQYGIFAFFTFMIFLTGLGLKIYKSDDWRAKMLGTIFIVTFLPLSIINSVYLASTDVWIYFSSFLCIIQYNKYRFRHQV